MSSAKIVKEKRKNTLFELTMPNISDIPIYFGHQLLSNIKYNLSICSSFRPKEYLIQCNLLADNTNNRINGISCENKSHKSISDVSLNSTSLYKNKKDIKNINLSASDILLKVNVPRFLTNGEYLFNVPTFLTNGKYQFNVPFSRKVNGPTSHKNKKYKLNVSFF